MSDTLIVEADEASAPPVVPTVVTVVTDAGGNDDNDTPPSDVHCQHCVEHAVAIAQLETKCDEALAAATIAAVVAEDAAATPDVAVELPDEDDVEPSRRHMFFQSRKELMGDD